MGFDDADVAVLVAPRDDHVHLGVVAGGEGREGRSQLAVGAQGVDRPPIPVGPGGHHLATDDHDARSRPRLEALRHLAAGGQ